MSRRFVIWSRVAFIVLLPILAYQIWDYIESTRLDARLAAIAQSNGPVIPRSDRQQAETAQALRYYRAAAVLMTYSPNRSPADRNRVSKAWLQHQWTPEALELARAEIADNRDALDFIDRAARLQLVDANAHLPGTEGEIAGLWQLGRLCELRAGVLASEGQDDDALASFAAEARLVAALDLTGAPLGLLTPELRGFSWVMERINPSKAERLDAARAFASIDPDNRLRLDLLRYRRQLLTGGPTWLLNCCSAPRWPRWAYRAAMGPFYSHALARALDDFDRLLAAADKPWPQRIDATIAVGEWPAWPAVFTSAADGERLRKILEEFTKSTAEQVQKIRCARLIVSPGPLDLVDPLTGRRLEMLNCHL